MHHVSQIVFDSEVVGFFAGKDLRGRFGATKMPEPSIYNPAKGQKGTEKVPPRGVAKRHQK